LNQNPSESCYTTGISLSYLVVVEVTGNATSENTFLCSETNVNFDLVYTLTHRLIKYSIALTLVPYISGLYAECV